MAAFNKAAHLLQHGPREVSEKGVRVDGPPRVVTVIAAEVICQLRQEGQQVSL